MAILLTGLVTAIRRRRWPVGRLLAVVALAVMAGYSTERAGHFPDVGMFPGWLYGVGLIVFILGGGCWLAWWFVADPRWPAAAPSIVDAH